MDKEFEFVNPSQAEIFDYLRKAKVIAVVGLSNREKTASNMVARMIQSKGYRVIPVNPKLAGGELLGETVYASILDIPFHIDIVDVFRRSDFLADTAREFIKTDAEVFWAQLGLQSEEAEEVLRSAGRDKIVMNRCLKVEYENGKLAKEL
ncbi:MAG: CoA-binding protein [Streptococcaceae bacterium]|jgi:predicted CoA-binding protein|nr:CoA-binding protein [Streptococcaceae bacterium]